jgi:hypothetical protein
VISEGKNFWELNKATIDFSDDRRGNFWGGKGKPLDEKQ